MPRMGYLWGYKMGYIPTIRTIIKLGMIYHDLLMLGDEHQSIFIGIDILRVEWDG
jgi:hypothetical protein